MVQTPVGKCCFGKIELPDKTKVEVKQHIIELIKTFSKNTHRTTFITKFFTNFSKTTYLNFQEMEFKREIAHLEETIIYKNALLLPTKREQSGLIKMLQKNQREQF
ncbi:MAG: hypothetical protein R2809_10885 [Flavobacteriales bacterium]